MECNLRNALAYMPQSRNQLGNRRSKNDKISRRMWKSVETEIRKVRVVKEEGGREGGKGKKTRTKRTKKEGEEKEKI